MTRRQFVALLSLATLAASSEAQESKPGADVASLVELINKLRTDPVGNALFAHDLAKVFDENYRTNETFTKEDKRDGKSSLFYFDALAANLKTRTKVAPLLWDSGLATIAAEKGKPRNRLFKPEFYASQESDKSHEVLMWWASFGSLEDMIYRLLDPSLQRIGVAKLKAANAGSVEFHLVASPLPGTAFTLTDAELAGRPYDVRTDSVPVRDTGRNEMLEPMHTSFVRKDGSLDVAWKDQGSPTRVFVSRFTPEGKKILQVEVGAAEAATYPLLAGFTEDPEGNLYILKAKDEGNLNKQPQPATPTGTPESEYDRPEVMKLWKLDSNGKELWARYLTKDRGGANATFSPLSSDGKGKFISTARLAFTTLRQPIYRLAADPSVVLPPEVVEPGLLGYTTGDDGKKRTELFAAKDQATRDGETLTPKVALLFEKDWEQGFAAVPAIPDGEKAPVFFPDGTPNSYARSLGFDPAKYAKFVAFVKANKEKWGDGGDLQVPAAKLKLTASAETQGVLFAIYGCATDYDFRINARHQQAYWRAVRADTGEALSGRNGWAMGHCFDMHVLSTDEGVITVERSDIGIIAANYLRQPHFRGHKAYVFEHAWYYNNCFSELGSVATATDGYAILIASNRSPAEPVVFSGNQERLKEEEARPRELALVRIKKGFADEIDKVGKGGEYRSFPDPDRNKLPDGLITLPATYFTSYNADNKFDATRPRMVRTGENAYVVVWERWVRNSGDGIYDSTWAATIDRDGKVLKTLRLAESPRISRSDPAFSYQGKCAWVTGDALDKRLLLHTLDSELKYQVVSCPLAG